MSYGTRDMASHIRILSWFYWFKSSKYKVRSSKTQEQSRLYEEILASEVDALSWKIVTSLWLSYRWARMWMGFSIWECFAVRWALDFERWIQKEEQMRMHGWSADVFIKKLIEFSLPVVILLHIEDYLIMGRHIPNSTGGAEIKETIFFQVLWR